jgi:hypothetical protein
MLNDLEIRKKIWIVGLFLEEAEQNPNLFAIIQTGDIEQPIIEDGKVMIFRKGSLIKYLYEKYQILYIGDELYNELDLVVNLSILIKKIKYSKTDTNSIILNTLNIFFDLVKHLHKGKRKHINVQLFYSFSNHLTFEKEFAENFIKKNNISRNQILDSIYWNIGLLLSNSKII